MRKLIIIIILLFPSIVLARTNTSCDYTLLANIKKLASNVNTTYTYKIVDNEVYFDITLTNITNDMYFIDNTTDKTYHYSDTNNGVITISNYESGKVSFTFYSNNSECMGEKLKVKYVNLPYYNEFYSYEECKGIEEFNLCNKWMEYYGGYYDFKTEVNEYKDKTDEQSTDESPKGNKNFLSRLVLFYTNYYYIIIPIIIAVLIIVIYIVKYIKQRLNRFKI